MEELKEYLEHQIYDYKKELQNTEDEDTNLYCIHKIDTYNEILIVINKINNLKEGK